MRDGFRLDGRWKIGAMTFKRGEGATVPLMASIEPAMNRMLSKNT
jgi:hypothetical protein